jgi:cellulose synthase/poly-beta-1,6-N-acetylglucosamine synthase-like glycosyltransferase
MLGLAQDVAERVAFLVASLIVVVHGAYQGLQIEAVSFDVWGLFVRVVTIDAIPATLVFAAVVLCSGAMLAREVHGEGPEGRVRSGPRVAAIVPAHEDGDVLEESVGSLLASNYEDLEVAIVTEPGEGETQARARELAEHPDVRVLENRFPGSKAGAIDDAVERLDADVFAAFDADERVDPAYLPAAVHTLTEEGADVFQARRVPRVTGAVEALAYGERLLFHAGHKIVEPFGFTYCRSSSVAFTPEAHEAVGGFDDVLTEDLDFAHACFRANLDVRQSRSLTNEMEAPHTLADLWGQRKRWRMGHIEVFLKALRGGFDHGGWRGALSTARLATTLAANLFLLALTAKVLVLLVLDLEILFLVPLVAVALAAVPVVIADREADHIVQSSPAMALIPLIYPGFGLVAIRSGLEYALSWDGEWYQVDKTGS